MALKISGGNELINARKLLEQGGIKIGMKVADLGCGANGHFVFPAAHLVGEQGVVYAVDILKTVLGNIESRARMEGVTNVQIIWSDLERANGMKIENGSVDIALFVNTLFQVKDKLAAIKEATRILKIGGVLIVGEWKTAGGGAGFGPVATARVDANEIKKMAPQAGLALANEFEAGPYHYGMVFKKI